MQTKQYNLKLPDNLAEAAEDFAMRYGYRNVQELALDSLREKIFENSAYDETFTEHEIALVEKLTIASIEKGEIVDEKKLRAALRT